MSIVQLKESTARLVAAQLLEIQAIKLNSENPFTWSSGWKSPIYCDNRLSLSYPALRSYIKEQLAEAIKENFQEAACIAGVATAGVPQGALVADLLDLPYIYVRPKPKDHGMGNLIEGKIEKGQKVVLVEDLISTGGSSLKAAQALQEAGFVVLGMVAIFTYGFDVASKNFEDAKIPLVCLSDFNSLVKEAVAKKYISEDQLTHIQSWRVSPETWGK
jgi:orotate phosphoribosyltransferase